MEGLSAFTGIRTENSDSNISMMQPTDQSMRHDATDPLNRTREWRILVAPHWREATGDRPAEVIHRLGWPQS